jgi:hypothetical protein
MTDQDERAERKRKIRERMGAPLDDPPPEDPEVLRARRDLAQAGDHEHFKATGHGVHVLWALGRYRADEELPRWIREWLLDLARGVLPTLLPDPATPLDVALDNARQATLRAFGLGPNQGGNIIAKMQQDAADDALAVLRFIGEHPIPAKELAETFKVEQRQIRTRTNRARKRWPEIR